MEHNSMSNAVTVPADKLAKLQRDAARYRWLTKDAYIGECYTDQVPSGVILEVHGVERRVPDEVGEFCDVGEAIDAAMAAESAPAPGMVEEASSKGVAVAKAKLPRGPLKVFSANNTTAILDADGNEVVGWMGFDDSNRTRAEHELLARELVARFNAHSGSRVEKIHLTDAQRKLLTVSGDVHIPGLSDSGHEGVRPPTAESGGKA
jgi:hypothetical protein